MTKLKKIVLKLQLKKYLKLQKHCPKAAIISHDKPPWNVLSHKLPPN